MTQAPGLSLGAYSHILEGTVGKGTLEYIDSLGESLREEMARADDLEAQLQYMEAIICEVGFVRALEAGEYGERGRRALSDARTLLLSALERKGS